jgi:CubicO group peptidase (beta-lactamase class C family)
MPNVLRPLSLPKPLWLDDPNNCTNVAADNPPRLTLPIHRETAQCSEMYMTRITVMLIASVFTLNGAARAQDSSTTPRHAAAQAAGSRALHYCTGLFSSEMPRAVIESTDRSSPNAQQARMKIDEQKKIVSVHYADDMEPRLAIWRPVLGCTLLPIGATSVLGDALPRPSGAAPALDDRPWPIGDKNAVAQLPVRAEKAVEKLIDEAFRKEDGIYQGRTWGILVVKDGKIAAERYQDGFGPHIAARTNSMCKSIAASLVGVGVRKGLLDLHRKAPLVEWSRPGDPRGEITLDHMMHMASGLYTEMDGNPQAELYTSGAAAAEVSALNTMDSRPGQRYVYSGSDTILLVRALRQAVNNDASFLTFPHRELLWKLGMTRTVLETDWNNDFLLSGQCWSTARDFARFGLLYLADGLWDGERILPEGWSKYVSTPAPAQPQQRREGRYGGQFWVYGGEDGLPEEAYSPNGAFGQYAMIIPSKNLVVVRRGLDDRQNGFRIAKFSADVMNAIAD